MARRIRSLLVALLAGLVLIGDADAIGGNYVFRGGTAKQRAQVRAALDASAFNWSLVPRRITIHLTESDYPSSTPGHIWIGADLLDGRRHIWAWVQHEYAHQVDFFLFNDRTRSYLNRVLGGRDWCYGKRGLEHHEYGCERFASTLTWSYWPLKDNAFSRLPTDEWAAMRPTKFRALMARLVGARATLR